MTKLFSMKSLAFAGAAAFALTLVAAPKADAADVEIKEYEYRSNGDVRIFYDDDSELDSTEDGNVIYYQVGKTVEKIKEGKYTAIADENRGKEVLFNFSKFFGKEQILSISTNGDKSDEKATKHIQIVAAPKLKAKYTPADGVVLTIGTTEVKGENIVSGSAVTKLLGGKKYADCWEDSGVYAKAGDKIYEISGLDSKGDFLKRNIAFGGTVEVKVRELQEIKDNTPIEITSWSKVAKMKISAKAKAPKVSLKLDATKAFEWNLNNKQEYIIKSKSANINTSWKDGTKGDWATIFKNAGVSESDVTKIVSGDAIMADITISVRTKATDKKAASSINLVSLKKSAASPTTSAITVETTKASNPDKNGKFKTATGASIKANVENVQYSTDKGVKWKKLSNTKATKLKTGETNVLVRVVTPSKKGTVLPSLNTGVTWNTETGVATISPFDYSGDTVVAGTTTTVTAK